MSRIKDRYIEWIFSVIRTKYIDPKKYTFLLKTLYDTEFIYYDDMDRNRSCDGLALRYRFGAEKNICENVISKEFDIFPCSVLEMMIALSIRAFESTTNSFPYPIKPNDMFWMMIDNMNLIDQTNDMFNINYVQSSINFMMSKSYGIDGKGGLFYIPNTKHDMRTSDIWYQMQWWATYIWYEQLSLKESAEKTLKGNGQYSCLN